MKGSFDTGTSAAGYPVKFNTFIYTTGRLDGETAFVEQIQQALQTYNVTEDDIPALLRDGSKSVPSCISEFFYRNEAIEMKPALPFFSLLSLY